MFWSLGFLYITKFGSISCIFDLSCVYSGLLCLLDIGANISEQQVEDFGCGIDPQEITKIFNRFKDPQVTSNRSTNSGFGLAISKRLLKLMGGRIWVERDGLGKGCTAAFIIKLGTSHGTSAMRWRRSDKMQVLKK